VDSRNCPPPPKIKISNTSRLRKVSKMVDHLLWLGVVCDARRWSFLVLERFVEIVHRTVHWTVRPTVHDPKLGFHVHFCASYFGKDIANHKLYHTHVILPCTSTPLLPETLTANPNPITLTMCRHSRRDPESRPIDLSTRMGPCLVMIIDVQS
jgi:hypothetical protein